MLVSSRYESIVVLIGDNPDEQFTVECRVKDGETVFWLRTPQGWSEMTIDGMKALEKAFHQCVRHAAHAEAQSEELGLCT